MRGEDSLRSMVKTTGTTDNALWKWSRDVDVPPKHPAVQERIVVCRAETLQLKRLLVATSERNPRRDHVSAIVGSKLNCPRVLLSGVADFA